MSLQKRFSINKINRSVSNFLESSSLIDHKGRSEDFIEKNQFSLSSKNNFHKKRESLQSIILQQEQKTLNEVRDKILGSKQRELKIQKQLNQMKYHKQLVLIQRQKIEKAQKACIQFFKALLKSIETQIFCLQVKSSIKNKFQIIQKQFSQFIDLNLDNSIIFIQNCFKFQNFGSVKAQKQVPTKGMPVIKQIQQIKEFDQSLKVHIKNTSKFSNYLIEKMQNPIIVSQYKIIQQQYKTKNTQLTNQLKQKQDIIKNLKHKLGKRIYKRQKNKISQLTSSSIVNGNQQSPLLKSYSNSNSSSFHRSNQSSSFRLNMLNFGDFLQKQNKQKSQEKQSNKPSCSSKNPKERNKSQHSYSKSFDKQNIEKNINIDQALLAMKKKKLSNTIGSGKISIYSSNSALLCKFYRKKFNV